jgi:hypothetical protein
MRKLIDIERNKLDALLLLARDRHVHLQDLMAEAVDDLLKKHRRPTTVREMFDQSVGRKTAGARPRRR